jgi:hypothetical protein
MRKRVFQYLLGGMIVSLLPLSLSAGEFDGSKPLVCASIHAAECGAEEQGCLSGPPWMMNFPVFLEIDFAAGKATTTRQYKGARVSEIELVVHLHNKRMSIQGTDGDYSWSMLVSEETGSMTLAVAGEEVGFVVFGACTPR